MFQYPDNLADAVRARWNKRWWRERSFPSDRVARQLLAVAYQASMLVEEGRPVHFRVALVHRDAVASQERMRRRTPWMKYRNLPTPLDPARRFSVPELLKLAPATDSTQVVICVEPIGRQSKLMIWAIMQAGSSWWRSAHRETNRAFPPPYALTVASSGPGQLTVSRGWEALASLRNGEISTEGTYGIDHPPIASFFLDAEKALDDEAIGIRLKRGWGGDQGQGATASLYIPSLERLLIHVRAKKHGGALILLPPGVTSRSLKLHLAIKYATRYPHLWSLMADLAALQGRYYELFSAAQRMRDGVSHRFWWDYHLTRKQRDDVEDHLRDALELMAAFTEVDGAVVLSQKLEVMGFGAEVTSQTVVRTVRVAQADGSYVRNSVHAYGTRHRSAFRFAASIPGSLVFVVSQDGAVRAIRRRGRSVTLWPDLQLTRFGL